MNVVLDDAALPSTFSSTAPRDKRLRSERLAAQGYVLSSGQSRLRPHVLRLLPPATGLALLLLAWSIAATTIAGFPAPLATWNGAVALFDAALRRDGTAGPGIAWQILASLRRLGTGFAVAALAGIPLGFLAGRLAFVAGIVAPVAGLFKLVAPLAFLPVSLLVFKAGSPAFVAVIAAGAFWPLMHHTAIGVRRVPQDYMNVARVLKLSQWKILTRIEAPAALPHIFVGARRAVVAAWMVTIAAEMLGGADGAGGSPGPGAIPGLGFALRAAWRAGDMTFILIAIVVTGLLGLIIEQLLVGAATLFTYADVE